MTLLLTMLPLYLFGNLHCLGMCGPLVMMIGRHRFRLFYFAGRLLSFTLAGGAAGGFGAVLAATLQKTHLPALASFLFGGIIAAVGMGALFGWRLPQFPALSKRLGNANRILSALILKDRPWPTFLFGFFTILLPCGQTIIVYSACALSGSAAVGLINGFAFALLTSPSLFFAMQTARLLQRTRRHYNTLMGLAALIIGGLALCRGLAEIGYIPHWVLNPSSPQELHIVMF